MRFITLSILLLAASACGLKGDLTIPERAPAPEQTQQDDSK
ncbi:MAG: hypothetical protein OXT49_09925 [Gammaproteobacteria bacterium]|nr:hypothetical protein [Gammaproteobacteria bacterium]